MGSIVGRLAAKPRAPPPRSVPKPKPVSIVDNDAVANKNEYLVSNMQKLNVEKTTKKLQPEQRAKPSRPGLVSADGEGPKGYVNVGEIVSYLRLFRTEPEKYTAEKLAEMHRLSPVDAQNVLRYFALFTTAEDVKQLKRPNMKITM